MTPRHEQKFYAFEPFSWSIKHHRLIAAKSKVLIQLFNDGFNLDILVKKTVVHEPLFWSSFWKATALVAVFASALSTWAWNEMASHAGVWLRLLIQ